MAVNESVVVRKTAGGVKVYARPGSKRTSEWDFIISYDRPNEEPHQVFHRDFIIDIYRKRQVAPDAFPTLVDHLIEIIKGATGVTSFPPELIHFSQDHVENLLSSGLPNTVGYDLELFLVLFEFVQIQEETNYPGGWLPTELYETVRDTPEDLDRVAYLTEVGVPRRESRRNLRQRDKLLTELRGIVVV